ncbi:MAG: family 20 glycosylhydrolase [Planctomycetota bacterium]
MSYSMQAMRKTAATIVAALVMLFVPKLKAETDVFSLVPVPKQVERLEGAVSLSKASTIVVRDQQLLPLAKVLAHNIYMQSGLRLPIGSRKAGGSGIVLGLNPELDSEAYTISIKDSVEISGKDYRAIAWGTSTLLQLISSENGKVTIPRLSIKDAPDYAFRSVMLDLARRWHPIDTVKQTIDLLSLYKVNYLHLHLSDTQSCVYTSRVLPKMATRQAYSWEEMRDIVKYADERGVTIIPEIDVPGHSSSWVRKMPELFGTTDPKTGKSRPLGIVNMANEESYEALDRLVGELSEVFASSPYIHMGTDETGAGGLIKLPEYKPYCEKHGLTEAAEGKAHELFLHFIQRMNKIVRKHGKTAIAWNDFGGASTSNVTIPNNVTTMYWVGSPNALVSKGYPIINCCRLPLYMVPPQQSAPEDHRIYAWNAHTFANWHSKQPTVLPDTVPIKGAQICLWEQRYNEVLPILCPRVPAFAERLWNEDAKRTIDELRKRRDHTDQVVQKIIAPVTFETDGLIDDRSVEFEESLTVKTTSSIPGTIRYSLSKEWESFPDATSEDANAPITLNDTMTVSARLYDESGKPLGGVTQQRFRKMVPAYRYRLLGPTPDQGWPTMPDFDGLEELQTGTMGLMDRDRGSQINRAMFAGLDPHGHVDVRLHNIYNPFTLELTGQMKFPVDGEYTFKLKSRHGLSELHSDSHTIVAANVPGREYVVQGKVKAGTYPLTIKHFYRITQNELNIWVKKPGDTEFEPLEILVVPMSKWVDQGQLAKLAEDCRFVDPVKLAYQNLATDKPVKATSWQANHVPSNVVDGVPDNTSGWHADPYPQWLQVDLEKEYAINRIKLYTYYDGGRSYQYTIETSQDGKKWKPLVDMTKNVKPSSKEGDEHNFEPVRARFVKVNMTNNTANPGVHINELMVFEAQPAK